MKNIIGSDIAEKQGWDEETMLVLYNRFLSMDEARDRLIAFLNEVADKEQAEAEALCCECDDCDREFAEEELVERFPNITDLMNRIEPGGVVPVGTCRCGALAYPVKRAKK